MRRILVLVGAIATLAAGVTAAVALGAGMTAPDTSTDTTTAVAGATTTTAPDTSTRHDNHHGYGERPPPLRERPPRPRRTPRQARQPPRLRERPPRRHRRRSGSATTRAPGSIPTT